jgi:hypothetical protein
VRATIARLKMRCGGLGAAPRAGLEARTRLLGVGETEFPADITI